MQGAHASELSSLSTDSQRGTAAKSTSTVGHPKGSSSLQNAYNLAQVDYTTSPLLNRSTVKKVRMKQHPSQSYEQT